MVYTFMSICGFFHATISIYKFCRRICKISLNDLMKLSKLIFTIQISLDNFNAKMAEFIDSDKRKINNVILLFILHIPFGLILR